MPCAQKVIGENLFEKLMLAIQKLPGKSGIEGLSHRFMTG